MVAELVALPLFLLGFKWLLNVFEEDNPRNTWPMAAIVVATTVVVSAAVVALLFSVYPPLPLALTLGLVLTTSVLTGALASRILFKISVQRALGYSLAMPVGFLWSLQAIMVSVWTVDSMIALNPVFTVLLALGAGGVWAALHRHRARFSMQLRQLTSWLG